MFLKTSDSQYKRMILLLLLAAESLQQAPKEASWKEDIWCKYHRGNIKRIWIEGKETMEDFKKRCARECKMRRTCRYASVRKNYYCDLKKACDEQTSSSDFDLYVAGRQPGVWRNDYRSESRCRKKEMVSVIDNLNDAKEWCVDLCVKSDDCGIADFIYSSWWHEAQCSLVSRCKKLQTDTDSYTKEDGYYVFEKDASWPGVWGNDYKCKNSKGSEIVKYDFNDWNDAKDKCADLCMTRDTCFFAELSYLKGFLYDAASCSLIIECQEWELTSNMKEDVWFFEKDQWKEGFKCSSGNSPSTIGLNDSNNMLERCATWCDKIYYCSYAVQIDSRCSLYKSCDIWDSDFKYNLYIAAPKPASWKENIHCVYHGGYIKSIGIEKNETMEVFKKRCARECKLSRTCRYASVREKQYCDLKKACDKQLSSSDFDLYVAAW